MLKSGGWRQEGGWRLGEEVGWGEEKKVAVRLAGGREPVGVRREGVVVEIREL